jgi:hypothetical protein
MHCPRECLLEHIAELHRFDPNETAIFQAQIRTEKTDLCYGDAVGFAVRGRGPF